MKKLFNNSLFTFILGSIIFCSIGVYASSTYYANQIKYIKSNNEEITLDSALNELYTSANNTELDISDLTSFNAWSAGIRKNPRTTTIELNQGQYLLFATSTHTYSASSVQSADNLTTVNSPSISGDNGNCVSIDKMRQKAPATEKFTTDSRYVVSYVYEQVFLCNIDFKKTLSISSITGNEEANNVTSSVSVQAIKIK